MHVGWDGFGLVVDLLEKLVPQKGPYYRERVPLGKHLSACHHPHVGIAQIAFTPPPRTQTGTLGHFFSGAILPFLPLFYHFLWISAPNHLGKGLDPPKIMQMPIWTWKILL